MELLLYTVIVFFFLPETGLSANTDLGDFRGETAIAGHWWTNLSVLGQFGMRLAAVKRGPGRRYRNIEEGPDESLLQGRRLREGVDGFTSGVVCYSAGPDGEIDTPFNQPFGWFTGDDDAVVVISAGGNFAS